MRKLRVAIIVALVLAVPASAYAYYEISSVGCPLSDGCPCD